MRVDLIITYLARYRDPDLNRLVGGLHYTHYTPQFTQVAFSPRCSGYPPAIPFFFLPQETPRRFYQKTVLLVKLALAIPFL